VLEALQHAGLRHVWFTLLGLEHTHDDLCGRSGAFAAIVAGLERCAAVGLETGVNIVVSVRNVKEIGEIAERVRALGAERFVPTYVAGWSPLRGLYESIRPEPADLHGLPPAGLDVNWGYASFWADPESHTEAALTRAAMVGPQRDSNGERREGTDGELPLFVDAKLDVFVGSLVAPPVVKLANLWNEQPEEIYAKLIALEWPPTPLGDAELASRYGDSASRKVHMSCTSLRRKWIAAWRAEHQLSWLASY
jgi:hypothetical protein